MNQTQPQTQTPTKYPPNSRKIRRNVSRAIQIIEQHKRIKITKLAVMLDYNPLYFKYAIVPAIIEMTECIKRENDDLVYMCNEGGE